MYRGPGLFNYSCAPRCERTPMPGESDTAYQESSGPYTSAAARATGAARPQGE
jgi:hypothetical protein